MKYFFAIIGGTLTLFVMGAIWYGVVFESFYEAHAAEGYRKNQESVLWILFCGLLVINIVMTINFPKWLNSHYTFSNGFKTGAWIGVLVGLGWGLVMNGVYNGYDIYATFMDGFFRILEFGMAGGVIALILNKFKNE